MFARVVYGDSDEILINPNCYIRLIYEYIRIKAGVPDEVDIDLCDAKGNLKKINEPPSYKSGLELLELGETYYLVSIIVEKKGRLVVPLIDSSSALYETLLKKFEVNKLSVKNIKGSNSQVASYDVRRSKLNDAVIVTDLPKKKKKKKELKSIKSNKFPSFVDYEAKSDGKYIRPVKDSFQNGKKDIIDAKQSKDSKNNENLLTVRKNIWYFNPSGKNKKVTKIKKYRSGEANSN